MATLKPEPSPLQRGRVDSRASASGERGHAFSPVAPSPCRRFATAVPPPRWGEGLRSAYP
jgi:hypothetical protein